MTSLRNQKSVWTKDQCCIRFSSRTPGDVSINEFRQVWPDQMGSILKAHVPFMKTSSVQCSILEWISGRLDDLSKLDTKSCRAHRKSFTQLYKYEIQSRVKTCPRFLVLLRDLLEMDKVTSNHLA